MEKVQVLMEWEVVNIGGRRGVMGNFNRQGEFWELSNHLKPLSFEVNG